LKDRHRSSNNNKLRKWNKEEQSAGLNLAVETRVVLIMEDAEADLEEEMDKINKETPM
jgi:hypothetical protein